MKTVKLEIKDYKRARKRDANCFATHLLISNGSTLECIQVIVTMVSDKYPDKEFIIEHDGIIAFSIKCDNKIIYTGTHYDVEDMLQEGCYVFRDKLLENIE